MRVLYDHQAFTMQHFGGVSKSFCELIRHLPSNILYDIAIKESKNLHLNSTVLNADIAKSEKFDFFSYKRLFHFRGDVRLYEYAKRIPLIPILENVNRRYAIKVLKRKNFDIFHPTFFDDYFLNLLNNKPFVLTIHDMMPELFPQYYGFKDSQILMKKRLAKYASAIVTVSQHTKKDIIQILGVPDNRIRVIYHGGPERKHSVLQALFDFPYFLYVGTRWGYKNFSRLLMEFRDFKFRRKEYADIRLVCTGMPFNDDENKQIFNLNLENSIIGLNATDTQLESLYSNAIAFVFPSLYEGFGMPILESYAYGCPVLLNNKSCFPEIARDAAIYFNSDEKESNIADYMELIVNLKQSERQSLINKGYERLSAFSWEKSSQELAKLYESIS